MKILPAMGHRRFRSQILLQDRAGHYEVPHTAKSTEIFDSVWSESLTQPGTGTATEQRSRMHYSDYYREQAQHYRQVAAEADDPAARQEFLELAAACEDAADKMDDCRASG